MSQNIVPINLACSYYPPVKIDNVRTWSILHGCAENSGQTFISTSLNNSQINITANPPSNKTIINRVVWVKNKYHLEFSATPVVGQFVLGIGTTDAPRCEPIASTTNTLQVTINNDQYTTNLNRYWSALSRYHNRLYNRDEFKSMTPSFLDKFQTYGGVAVGSVRNPLGSVASSADGQLLRGGYTRILNLVNVAGAGTASLDLEVTEPINISPFLFSDEDNLESGLIGVNNMGFIFTNSTLDRLWCHSSLGSSGFSVNLTTSRVVSSQVQFNYLTPQIDDALPLMQSWPYFEVTPYPQTLPSPGLAPGASTIISTNNIQIKAIPDKIYIFAKRSQSTETVFTTDTFASVTNISMTFGNRTGLLSTYSEDQLYEMSVKNGLTLDFSEFNNYVGSVICIKPGEDLGLSPLSAPGMLENTQLTINVSLTNPNPVDTVIYDLIVVIVNSGTCSMVNGSFMHQVGVFNSQDVLNSRNLAMVPYKVNNSIYGGSWWDDFKSGFKSVVSPALDVVQMIPGAHQPFVNIGRKLTGLGGRKRKVRGRALVGGALMDRDMLRDRMMEME